MHAEIAGPDDYKKRQEAIKRKLKSAAESSGSEILKSQSKKENRKDTPEVQDNCQMARMLVDEGLEMYKSGDMSFSEFVEDLHKSLMAVSGRKGAKDDEDVDNEG